MNNSIRDEKDFLEPLLLESDHRLFFSFSFRSTLNPSTLGSLAGWLPHEGARLNGLSGVAWFINRFSRGFQTKSVCFNIKGGRIGSWRNMNKPQGVAKYISTWDIYTIEKIKISVRCHSIMWPPFLCTHKDIK